MRFALATCPEKPQGTSDDALLVAELLRRGHSVENVPWSQAGHDWAAHDLCLLRSPWDYYKHLPAFLAWTKKVEEKTRLVNASATVARNADKAYLLELEEKGLPIIPSFISSDAKKLIAKCQSLLSEAPIIVKPSVSGGSFLTFRMNDGGGLEENINRLVAHGPAIVQPFLPSVENEGEISLVYFRLSGNWRFSHAVLKTARPGDFRVQSEFGGAVAVIEPSAKVLSLCERILRELAPGDIYVRIDLVDWQSHPKIGEIEPIEPALFFSYAPNAAILLAQALEAVKKPG